MRRRRLRLGQGYQFRGLLALGHPAWGLMGLRLHRRQRLMTAPELRRETTRYLGKTQPRPRLALGMAQERRRKAEALPTVRHRHRLTIRRQRPILAFLRLICRGLSKGLIRRRPISGWKRLMLPRHCRVWTLPRLIWG